jgi:glutamate-5-semialdehyde dehydrogenase
MTLGGGDAVAPAGEIAPPAQDTAGAVVRAAAVAAAEASTVVRAASHEQVRGALVKAADNLVGAAGVVLAANAEDLAAAVRSGLPAALVDRLRLDDPRMRHARAQLMELAEAPAIPRLTFLRQLGDGSRVYERRVPVGVVGATYEARPLVTLDIAGQLLRAGSAAVLRTGAAAVRSATTLVDAVLAPALREAGLPTDAVVLVPEVGHTVAEALVTQPDLVPLVIVRGSGDTTRRLSGLGAAAGVRILAHADGGGVLYADKSADVEQLAELIAASVDRLGVCNRLNLLLVHRDRWDELSNYVSQVLEHLGVHPLLPPHDQPLGHEWALDAGREATVTVAPVDGPLEAAALASRETSGIAATIAAADPAAAVAFLDAWGGTGAFWGRSTRLLDGYTLLGVPETGINVDRYPGPRGPVTFRDLALRQFLVLPAGAEAVAEALSR